jgi:hypothetical protein
MFTTALRSTGDGAWCIFISNLNYHGCVLGGFSRVINRFWLVFVIFSSFAGWYQRDDNLPRLWASALWRHSCYFGSWVIAFVQHLIPGFEIIFLINTLRAVGDDTRRTA